MMIGGVSKNIPRPKYEVNPFTQFVPHIYLEQMQPRLASVSLHIQKVNLFRRQIVQHYIFVQFLPRKEYPVPREK